MEKVSKTILDAVLENYKPECKYLIEASVDYPKMKGNFNIPCTFYAKNYNSEHFNAIETIFCYNQLAYTGFAEFIFKGLISGLEKISLDKFREHQLTKMLILKMDEIKFRKLIDPKEFEGVITLDRVINRNNLIFFKTSYDFENGEATGKVDLALLKK